MYDEEEYGKPAVKVIQEDEGAPDTPLLTEEDIKQNNSCSAQRGVAQKETVSQW